MSKIFYWCGWVLLCVVCLGITELQGQELIKPYSAQLRQIEQNLRGGNLPLAVEGMDEILKSYPDAAEVYYAKALVFGQLKNMEVAVDNAQKAYKYDKNLLYANYLLDLYKNTSNLQGALDFTDVLIADFPQNSDVLREKVVLLFENNQSQEALEMIDEIQNTLGQTDTLAVLQSQILTNTKQNKKAKEVLEYWVDKKSDLGTVYSSLAFILMGESSSKKAIHVLNKGVANTGDHNLFLDLAEVYDREGKSKDSFGYLERAFNSDKVDYRDKHRIIYNLINERNPFTTGQLFMLTDILTVKYPRMVENYLFKGEVYTRMDDFAQAKSMFATAVEMNKNHLGAWRMLINTDLATNDVQSAIRHGEEALVYNPNNSMLLYFTGLSYFIKDDLEQSRKILELALDYSQNETTYLQSSIYSSLADLYHKIELFDLSDAAYEEAILLDSTNLLALNNYAYYLSLRQKKLEKAAEVSLLSNQLSPDNGTFQDTYAWVLYQQNNYEEALVWIERAIKNSDAPSSTVIDHYGDILSGLGRGKEAVKQWQRALVLVEEKGEDGSDLKRKINQKENGK